MYQIAQEQNMERINIDVNMNKIPEITKNDIHKIANKWLHASTINNNLIEMYNNNSGTILMLR